MVAQRRRSLGNIMKRTSLVWAFLFVGIIPAAAAQNYQTPTYQAVILQADPSNSTQAARKGYVDTQVGNEATRAEAAEASKLPTASAGPLATQAGASPQQALVNAMGAVHTITAGSTYAVLPTDLYVCIKLTTPGLITLTLPSTYNQSNLLNIKDCAGNAATYPITLNPASGTIDGQSTIVMPVNYESLTLSYNGTGWSIW